MNIFIALKGTHFVIFISYAETGVGSDLVLQTVHLLSETF